MPRQGVIDSIAQALQLQHEVFGFGDLCSPHSLRVKMFRVIKSFEPGESVQQHGNVAFLSLTADADEWAREMSK